MEGGRHCSHQQLMSSSPSLMSSSPSLLSSSPSLLTRADFHFMDKTALGKEASEEVTRELLISIAYCLPEKVNAPTDNLVEGIDSDCDGTEKYRSELISISDLQSPYSKGLPVMLGDIKD